MVWRGNQWDNTGAVGGKESEERGKQPFPFILERVKSTADVVRSNRELHRNNLVINF